MSSLNLVLCDKASVSTEMKYFSVDNVGWAAEVVDDWNAVMPAEAAVQSHSSASQSSDSVSSILPCATFCKCLSFFLTLVFSAFDAVSWMAGRAYACKKVSDDVLAWLMVIYLERGANDLHMVQQMPLPLHHHCFTKIENGLSFLPSLSWKKATK